jgi:hypothetical protein
VLNKELSLGIDLHTFRDDTAFHRVGDCDDGECQRLIFSVSANFLNECPVNLDAVDIEPLQIAQTRVTGAEVINGDFYSKLAQRRSQGRAGHGTHRQAAPCGPQGGIGEEAGMSA